ncbi:MAG: hypothetical protein ACRDV1_04360 [Actinomycetes bacterium]
MDSAFGSILIADSATLLTVEEAAAYANVPTATIRDALILGCLDVVASGTPGVGLLERREVDAWWRQRRVAG